MKKKSHHKEHTHSKKQKKYGSVIKYFKDIPPHVMILVGLVVVLLGYNQVVLATMPTGSSAVRKDFSDVDFSSIKSTGHSVAAFFAVEDIQTQQDAVDIMIPTGTPEYGPALGVSYDQPVQSLDVLMRLDRSVQLSQEDNDRYVALVTQPLGISCEFCCGVGPVGVNAQGKSICGCKHNPALLGLTKWLIQNTDYSDAEIVHETLKWKTLFFPKDMVNLALTVAGGDTSGLDDLPGMVGGC